MQPIAERLSEALAGRYTIVREIGQGGMATVFLAHDDRVDRRVAIKVLTPELHHGVNPDRFVSETRTVANLQHPHILPLFETGEADGLLYYTMPYVEGLSLPERIERGPLEIAEALSILREVGSGLEHAHEQGLIHRDVKPANILLSSGHALLADFGLARAVEVGTDISLTRTGVFVGSCAYLSPEQASGAEEVDRRSDLYSLGCVAYELLTGRTPFEARTPLAMLAAHAASEVPSVAERRPTVPVHIAAAVARAMAKDPAERQQSVADFLDELRGSSTSAPVMASGAGRPGAGHRREVVTVVAIGALLGIGGLVVTQVGTAPRSVEAATSLVPSRVVVAPLENRTGDPSLDQLGRLAADMITEGLHRTGVVDVVPGPIAVRAAEVVDAMRDDGGAALDPIEGIAVETSSGKVVSGAFYLDGEELLFQTQITDAVSGQLLEALESVRGPAASPSRTVDGLRDRVMGALAVHLDQRLGPAWVEQIPTPTFDSYRTFDRGMREYMDSDWPEATELFLSAYELDTTFVLPLQYAALSAANTAGGYPIVDSVSIILDGRRDELGEYHQHWLDWVIARKAGRNEEGRIAIRQAAQLAPASKAVYNSAYAAQLTNRPAEAVEALESLAPERGPMRGWFPYWDILSDNLHRVGRHEGELQAARAALEHYPDRLWGYVFEGEALTALGRTDEAVEVVREALRAPGLDVEPNFVALRVGKEMLHHGYEEDGLSVMQIGADWYEDLPGLVRSDVADYVSDRARGRIQEVHVAVLTHLGRFEEARQLQRQLVDALPGDPLQVGTLGILDARLGNRHAAEGAIERLMVAERDDQYSRGIYSLAAAQVAATLGDAGRAAELLERSFAEGERPLRHPGIHFDLVMDHPGVRAYFTPRG